MGQLEGHLTFIGEQVLFGQAGRKITRMPSIDVELYEQFGLLMRLDDQWTATRLFTSLSGGKNALDFSQTGAESRGFLVVETNYRVYAYTSSPLQIATLALVHSVTRPVPKFGLRPTGHGNCAGAMAHGITSDQILEYLQMNVHPCMTEGRANVPFNGIPFTDH